MTTTKTSEQLAREQLDILNELTDTQARLADAERAKAEAVAAERDRCARIAESFGEPFVTHGIPPQSERAREAREWIAAAIRTPGTEPHVSEEERALLRRVWAAFGCASNPDDYLPTVRAAMWEQVVSMAEESYQRSSRVYRENQQLERELAALRVTAIGADDAGREETDRSFWESVSEPDAREEADHG